MHVNNNKYTLLQYIYMYIHKSDNYNNPTVQNSRLISQL